VISFDQHTLRLFGLPVFTLIVGAVCLAALAGLVLGVLRWRQRSGRVVLLASALVLLLLALAVVMVLITVLSGSMG
jgi:hypothetical protein